MKELNVNLKFEVEDEISYINLRELIDYMVDCAWDVMHDYNEKLISYSITDGSNTYRHDFEYEEDENNASE